VADKPAKRPLRLRIQRMLGVWGRLMPYLRPHKKKLFRASLLTILVVLVEVAKPWPLKVVIDQVLLGQDWDLLPDALGADPAMLTVVAICVVVLLAAIGGLASYWRNLWLAESGQRMIGQVRSDALDAMLLQSMSFHERHRAGDLLVRLSGDAQSLRTLLVEGVFSLGREGLLLVGTLVVMLLVDWRLALASMLVLPAIATLLAVFSVRLRQAARKQRKKEGHLATAAHETLAAVPLIQAYGLEETASNTFAKQHKKSARAGLAATRIEGRLALASEVALALGTAFVLWLGVGRVQEGALSPGKLLVVIAYVRSFYRPIRKGLGRSAAMVKAGAAGERVLELLDAQDSLSRPTNPVALPAPRGEVEFRDVHFRHGEEREVLRGASLKLRPGECVALVGGNGAGKTTLISLLPRLRDPDSGEILLDGVDIRSCDLGELRSRLALVLQETVLFDGTLQDNVQLGAPDATTEQVMAAARMAGVTAFAERLPDGMQTKVGQRGAELSGGERQRVALARALVRNAAVYVLDEPTSGLDADAEASLCDDLLTSLKDKCVLIITHNPRLIARADRTVCMMGGRIEPVAADVALTTAAEVG